MRKYQTPNPEDCVVSPGAKQMIDGTTDIISHLRYTLEEAKRLGVDGNVLEKVQQLIDLNSDLVAIVCQIDRIQDGAGMEQALNQATGNAMQKHFMNHLVGDDIKDSPARVDPARAAKAGGRGRDDPPDGLDGDVL